MDAPVQSTYIPKFHKFFSFGAHVLAPAPMGVKYGVGQLPCAKFHSYQYSVLPLRGKKTSKWPPSNLNTSACSACVLPVKKHYTV